ncbi:MAG: FMN-binding protein [Flavobacteriaceae bacterium]|nr:MAG: FMN-binding protein [Flavobacteriaceae bacterium]
MWFSQQVSFFLVLLSYLIFGIGIPKEIEKKVNKEIEKTFDSSVIEMQPVIVPDEMNKLLPAKITETNFFMLSQESELLGYLFVDKAPSKTAQFDYLVIFDQDLKVIHSKVLVYREEYGGEIGSKRWLKQFLGKTGNDRVSYESNIDAIAGATISVRSMTLAMDKLFRTIGQLQENKVL